jgi:hypothetical protein
MVTETVIGGLEGGVVVGVVHDEEMNCWIGRW